MMNHTPRPSRRMAWLAMCAMSVTVAVVSFVVLGIFGGFMLLLALNGFSEKQAQPILLTYLLLVLGLTTLAGALFNWLVVRYGFRGAGLPGWAVFVPAAAASLGLILVGPALFFLVMPALFKSGL